MRRSIRGNRARGFRRPLYLEWLETRDQPSAGRMLPAFDDGVVSPLAQGFNFQGLTPAIVRNAYGFNGINFNGVPGDGRGQTIAIVTAYDAPTVQSDLRIFNERFGLPDVPNFRHVDLGPLFEVDAGWAMETALDVQWAHAIAPGADILLVSAASASLTDMVEAVNYARNQPGVSVVSMSWGAPEFRGQSILDGLFTTPTNRSNVSFVAASGDWGAAAGAMWPAASPNVLAVGGTHLTVDAAGNYRAESAWSGSGGGVSRVGSIFSNGQRSIPDVAYAAAPESGFLVYNSTPDERGNSGWYRVGGTSAGAPQWAALLAISNQGRALAGKEPLANARQAVAKLDDSAFNDIVTGSNGFAATAGYDLATGRGTPVAANVVSQLLSQAAPVQFQFVGPIPDAKTAERSNSTPRPPVFGGNGSQGLAAIALLQQEIARTNLASLVAGPRELPSRSLVTERTASDARTQPVVATPVLVAPIVSVSAVDLSKGGGTNEETADSGVNPEVMPPAGDGAPAAPAPAAPPAPAGAAAGAAPGTALAVASTTNALPAASTEPVAGSRVRRGGAVLLSLAGVASFAAGGFARWRVVGRNPRLDRRPSLNVH